MTDPVPALAHAVLCENLKVKKGESVVLDAWTHALPYVRAFVDEARRLGARPTVLYEDEGAWWDAVEHKRTSTLATLSTVERAVIRSADVYVHFFGPGDRPRLDHLPDAVQQKVLAWNEEWYRLARRGGLRGCRMSIGTATDPVAAEFKLDGPAWRQRLAVAGAADTRAMARKGAAVQRAIESGRELRVRHPNGTDLTLSLARPHVRFDVGRVDPRDRTRPYGMLANNPSGQVFVALDHAAAHGRFVSNRLVYLGSNRFGEADWTFTDGHLTERTTGVGGEMFDKQYARAPAKGRDLLGYVSIGLNPASRDLPPCEDTEEGAILIGIGRNVMAGGRNRVPFQGYALLGEATVEVDGQPLARGGRLL
jgi:leucyl aminopeptidase (aminopeptidase T)